jgi:hypothetical protein
LPLLRIFYHQIGNYIHGTIGLFEANDIIRKGLAIPLKAMFEKFGLISKVLCYVKDEGTNLASMITTLKYKIEKNQYYTSY